MSKKTKKISLFILGLLLSLVTIISFAESPSVPNYLITENPNKEVKTVEADKNREHGEMNISVNKLNLKNLDSYKLSDSEFYIVLDKNEALESDEVYFISKTIEEIPDITTVNGKKTISNLDKLKNSTVGEEFSYIQKDDFILIDKAPLGIKSFVVSKINKTTGEVKRAYSVENFKDTPIETISGGSSTARSQMELELNDEILKELTNTENEVKIGDSFKEILSVNKLERKITRGNLAYEIDTKNKKLLIENKDQLKEIKILVLNEKGIKKIYKGSINRDFEVLTMNLEDHDIGEVYIFERDVFKELKHNYTIKIGSFAERTLNELENKALPITDRGFDLKISLGVDLKNKTLLFEKTGYQHVDKTRLRLSVKNPFGQEIYTADMHFRNLDIPYTKPELVVDFSEHSQAVVEIKTKDKIDLYSTREVWYSSHSSGGTRYMISDNYGSAIVGEIDLKFDRATDKLVFKRLKKVNTEKVSYIFLFSALNSEKPLYYRRVRMINAEETAEVDNIDFRDKQLNEEIVKNNAATLTNFNLVAINNEQAVTVASLKRGVEILNSGVEIKYIPPRTLKYKKIHYRNYDSRVSMLTYNLSGDMLGARVVNIKNNSGFEISGNGTLDFGTLPRGTSTVKSAEIQFKNPHGAKIALSVEDPLKEKKMTLNGLPTVSLREIIAVDNIQIKNIVASTPISKFLIEARATTQPITANGIFKGNFNVIITVTP